MPIAQEEALKKVASSMAKKGKLRRKAGQSLKEAKNAFVYGIMRKDGWTPSTQKK